MVKINFFFGKILHIQCIQHYKCKKIRNPSNLFWCMGWLIMFLKCAVGCPLRGNESLYVATNVLSITFSILLNGILKLI